MACLFLSTPVSAKIIKDDVFVKSEKTYSFEQVCRALVKRESPLIEARSVGKLDCMGTIVNVSDFCQKEFERDPSYARAMVKDGKVKCQMATRVIMGYQCASSGDGLCDDKDIGCYKLREKFASNLFLSHASSSREGKGRKLNCYFSAQKNEDVLKLRPQEL